MYSIQPIATGLIYQRYSGALIPNMTDNITPSGYVASALSSSVNAYKAFDTYYGDYWNAGANGAGMWIQIQLPTAKTVTKYSFQMVFPNHNFTLNGSNDGSSWTVLDTQVSQGTNTFNLHNSTPYSYYRLLYSSSTPTPEVILLQLYGY